METEAEQQSNQNRVPIVVLFFQIIGDCLKYRFIHGVMQDIMGSGEATMKKAAVLVYSKENKKCKVCGRKWTDVFFLDKSDGLYSRR